MEHVEVVVQQNGVGNPHQNGGVLLGARNDQIQLGGVREQVEEAELEEVVVEKKGERYALVLPQGQKREQRIEQALDLPRLVANRFLVNLFGLVVEVASQQGHPKQPLQTTMPGR